MNKIKSIVVFCASAKGKRGMYFNTAFELGEEIVTAGGILGKVSKITDQYLELSISENTKIKVQ